MTKTTAKEDITHYSDTELSLRCYNEQPLYKAVRATQGDHNDLRTFIEGLFIFTELQLNDLVRTVIADIAEHPQR